MLHSEKSDPNTRQGQYRLMLPAMETVLYRCVWAYHLLKLQIRPIDRGWDHKPLIRLGDRRPFSWLAHIRERALSRRPVHSLLPSARARALSVNAPCLCPGQQPLSPQVGT